MAIFFLERASALLLQEAAAQGSVGVGGTTDGRIGDFFHSSTESCESMCTVVEGEVEWWWGSGVCRLPMPPPVGNEI